VTLHINPLVAAGVAASTAATDAVYVMFTSAVNARRPARAATWSSMWYLLAAFAVISYTGNPVYALFAAAGSWVGAYSSVRWLTRREHVNDKAQPPAHKPPAPIT
jgi:peptidoglycan biosynthesis protein MviN/MurJ (putative lipid II flippase)